MIPYWEYILRMVLACVIGTIIGFERRVRSKEAGIRTHCIVCCAAALMMIISKYGFFDLISGVAFPGAEVKLDPSRVAAGIVTAVGFLGTGMIFVDRQSVMGLTTAAGIWATTGIGMALGAGMYIVGVAAAVIILIAQLVLHTRSKWLKPNKTKILRIRNVDDTQYEKTVQQLLEKLNVTISDTNVNYNSESKTIDYHFLISIPWNVNEAEICLLFPYDNSIKSK